MRIVHLSDIHLSKTTYDFLINEYLDALILDLKKQVKSAGEIDLIVITGDLVDCGGQSLYEIEGYEDTKSYPSPFHIFEEIFINPISQELRIPKSNFLFIPGNHDIDEESILLIPTLSRDCIS